MKENLKKILNQFKITLFYLGPLHLISNITYKISRIEDNTIKNILIKLYLLLFKIELNECKIKNVEEYNSLNDFFTRELDLLNRKNLNDTSDIISPCDGTIVGFGNVNNNTFIHAKKYKYSIDELTQEKNNNFHNGKFINIYLEPKDCHRVYMPCDGILSKIIHIPGSLYSVAPYATESIKKLYAKNERVILSFKNNNYYISLIMIGAVNVGCISLTDQGIIAPAKYRNNITEFNDKNEIKNYKKGQEIGMFNLGSTVILLISENNYDWSENIIHKNKILIRDDMLVKFKS